MSMNRVFLVFSMFFMFSEINIPEINIPEINIPEINYS